MAEFAEVLINLLLILTLAWFVGKLFERIGYPAMMGELVAGIVFGPALLGILRPMEELEILAELGVFLLMVYVGMEMSPEDFGEVKREASFVAVGGLLIPFVLGYWVGLLIGAPVAGAFFVGIAMAATSLATKSRILVDLKLLRTRIAKVMVGGALMSDVGVLVLFAGVIGFVEMGTFDTVGIALVVAKAVTFFVVSVLIGMYLFPRLWRRMQVLMERYGFIDKTAAFTVFLLIALLFAVFAILAGLHLILGGFMAGLFLREVHFRKDIFAHMYDVTYDIAIGFFAPIFFVTATFALTLSVFQTALPILLMLVAVAFFSKIVGSWLFALPTRLTPREGLVVGLGMNGRGTVEIIIATIALERGLLNVPGFGPNDLFSMLVFIAILTTALVPATLKWGIDWLRRKGELVSMEPATPAAAPAPDP